MKRKRTRLLNSNFFKVAVGDKIKNNFSSIGMSSIVNDKVDKMFLNID